MSAISMQSAEKKPRNPVWSRDELILALDLYMAHPSSLWGKEAAPHVKELSEVLNALGQAMGRRGTATYRNVDGIYMKLANFRRFDPKFAAEGKSGLKGGNKDEEPVWNLFANDRPALIRVAQSIRDNISHSGAVAALQGPEEPEIQEAEEGAVLTRVHRSRERDRRLVESAKKVALRKHGRLHCAACGFDFGRRYGSAGEGIIDVHHTRPVHTLQPGERTKVSDLVLLCANCHRLVHSRRRWMTVEEVVKALEQGECKG